MVRILLTGYSSRSSVIIGLNFQQIGKNPGFSSRPVIFRKNPGVSPTSRGNPGFAFGPEKFVGSRRLGYVYYSYCTYTYIFCVYIIYISSSMYIIVYIHRLYMIYKYTSTSEMSCLSFLPCLVVGMHAYETTSHQIPNTFFFPNFGMVFWNFLKPVFGRDL